MKVTLATHGGHVRLPPQVVDTNALPKSAADELARLVAAAKAAPAGKEESPGSARDAMTYTLTIEDAGSSVTLRQSDTTVSPAFGALLGWIGKHSTGS